MQGWTCKKNWEQCKDETRRLPYCEYEERKTKGYICCMTVIRNRYSLIFLSAMFSEYGSLMFPSLPRSPTFYMSILTCD